MRAENNELVPSRYQPSDGREKAQGGRVRTDGDQSAGAAGNSFG